MPARGGSPFHGTRMSVVFSDMMVVSDMQIPLRLRAPERIAWGSGAFQHLAIVGYAGNRRLPSPAKLGEDNVGSFCLAAHSWLYQTPRLSRAGQWRRRCLAFMLNSAEVVVIHPDFTSCWRRLQS